MYLEVVKHLFKENELVKGNLELMGQKVDLSRIAQPLFMVAGDKDIITPPEQLFELRHHVASLSIEERLARAGHVGVFMRKQVINTIWSDIFRRLPGSVPGYVHEEDKPSIKKRCHFVQME